MLNTLIVKASKGSVAFVACLLVACSSSASYRRPDVPVPNQWRMDENYRPVISGLTGPTEISPDWWTRFGSAELNELIKEAIGANRDVAAARTRLMQASLSAQQVRSTLLPTANLSFTALQGRQTVAGQSLSASDNQPGGSISYEIDWWGRNSASVRAAEARAEASRYDRDAVQLIIQAEVAMNYFECLGLRDRLDIARSNAEISRQLMALIDVRLKSGTVTNLDVAQQRARLLTIEAQIPMFEQSVAETQNRLAVLLGRAPQTFSVAVQSLNDLALPTIDVGTPALLLERRPDIRSAEARLIAANADVAAAKAAFFPRIALTAEAATSGLLAAGSGSVSYVSASLVQSLFSGGRVTGQVRLSEAARRELVETYAQTVLTSLREVQDSLAAISNQASWIELLDETVDHAREAQRLASIRYVSGTESLSTLLDTQSSVLTAEDTLKQAQLARLSNAVRLFKALGGGWENERK